MEIDFILEPQEEGGYTVYVPSLPGCISQGETKEEVIENMKEVIKLHIEEIGIPEKIDNLNKLS